MKKQPAGPVLNLALTIALIGGARATAQTATHAPADAAGKASQVTRGANGVALVSGPGDLGAGINKAFAESGGSAAAPAPSAVVMLAPGGRYIFQTAIRMPNLSTPPFIEAPVLDCQGSSLVFAGAGYAINVSQQNGDSPSGQLRHCVLEPAPGNTQALGAVRQESRIWFTYDHLTLRNWTNAAGAGILLDNSRGVNWPGYNERNTLRELSFSNDAVGLRIKGNDGGTNSFARMTLEALCNLQDGQICVGVEGGADVYESDLSIHANVYSPSGRARVLSITGASIIRNSLANVGGEAGGTSGSLLYLDRGSKYLGQIGPLTNTGGLRTVDGVGITSDVVSTPITPGFFVLQATPDTLGLPQANNPKVTWDGRDLRMGLPVVNGFGNGSFQIYAHDTTRNPEVDAEGDPSNPENNLLFCGTSSGGPIGRDGILVGGGGGACGFGPGWGISRLQGGGRPKGATLPAAGTLDLGTWSLALNHVPVSQSEHAPSGPCSTIAWVLSNDGHITFCNGRAYVPKL